MRSVALFLVCVQVAVIAMAVLFYPGGNFAGFFTLLVGCVIALAAVLSIVWIGSRLLPDMRAGSGRIGPANLVTLSRFTLVASTAALLVQGHLIGALVFYGASGATDILDGAIARKRGDQTRFGVFMDPLADIFITTAVYCALWTRSLIPDWLFAILVFRYASLGLGAVLLHRRAPIHFQATPAGKISGVLQSAAGMSIMALEAAKIEWRAAGHFLYPFLAMVFGSVIVSQGIIAIRHLERTAHARLERRSGRFPADIGHADAESGCGDR